MLAALALSLVLHSPEVLGSNRLARWAHSATIALGIIQQSDLVSERPNRLIESSTERGSVPRELGYRTEGGTNDRDGVEELVRAVRPQHVRATGERGGASPMSS